MHTYVRNVWSSGVVRYGVGSYVPDIDGTIEFCSLFYVPTVLDAMAAVNYLNGGTGDIKTFPIEDET